MASWQRNAAPWITAVRERQIDSRRLVTDQAIVDAVLSVKPQTALDLGCGEGWLVRRLIDEGVGCSGVDAVAELIDAAEAHGVGDYHRCTYQALATAAGLPAVDAVVCNFSLIGDESVEQLFAALPGLLNEGGYLLVQTLHPLQAGGDGDYQEGWREGSWQGFSEAFTDPAPWYFRTLEGWQALFARHGFSDLAVREPLHPHTGEPASVLFTAQWRG